jgi:hypothetical protein
VVESHSSILTSLHVRKISETMITDTTLNKNANGLITNIFLNLSHKITKFSIETELISRPEMHIHMNQVTPPWRT